MHAAGALVAVVGPSGAGKDTLIGLARAQLAGDPRVVFPRRVVTRVGGPWEENDFLDDQAFAAAAASGAFVLHWEAHGLRYGIGRDVLATVQDGGVAVVNLSRAVVAPARGVFPRVVCVHVTAPPEVLAVRRQVRGRQEDTAARAARVASSPADLVSDVVIVNTGSPREAADRLVGVITESMSQGRGRLIDVPADVT